MSFCKVFFLDTDPLQDSNLFGFWYEQMPQYRKNKINNYKYDSDKRLSLGAGILLKKAMDSLNIDSPVLIDSNGKPYFENNPYYLSLSHSGNQAMCAVSDINIGCDIEQAENPRFNVAKRFFSKEENLKLDSFKTEKEKETMFFNIWTEKESYSKFTGLGLKCDFAAFDTEKTGTFFRHFDIAGYSSCICYGKTSDEIRVSHKIVSL